LLTIPGNKSNIRLLNIHKSYPENLVILASIIAYLKIFYSFSSFYYFLRIEAISKADFIDLIPKS
jgi:hypothetical protein